MWKRMSNGSLTGSCTRFSPSWRCYSSPFCNGTLPFILFPHHSIHAFPMLWSLILQGLIDHGRVCTCMPMSLFRIPIWYDVKLLFVLWLVVPHYKGAAFLYNRIMRGHVLKKLGQITDRYKSEWCYFFYGCITPPLCSKVINGVLPCDLARNSIRRKGFSFDILKTNINYQIK